MFVNSQESKNLSLIDAVNTAMQYNTSMLNSKLDIEIARKKVLETTSSALAATLHLEEILSFIWCVLQETMGVRGGSILLLTSESQPYVQVYPPTVTPIDCPNDHPLRDPAYRPLDAFWKLVVDPANQVIVHAGREDFEALGVHASPLDLSSTYPIRDLEAGGASLGPGPNHAHFGPGGRGGRARRGEARRLDHGEEDARRGRAPPSGLGRSTSYSGGTRRRRGRGSHMRACTARAPGWAVHVDGRPT